MADDDEFEKASRRNKTRPNIFDDAVSLDQARKTIISSQARNDDYDEEEEITFDGTPVVKYNNKSTGEPPTSMPDLSLVGAPATAIRSSLYDNHASVSSSSSYSNFKSASAVGHNRSRSLSIANSMIGLTSHSSSSLLDIEDASAEEIKRSTSKLDVEKLQQEIHSLRRSLLSAKKDRWIKPPIDNTLRRILKGEEFSLELYKSLEDKLQVLDQATKLHDGNAITAAALFLKRSVSSQIFSREIFVRPVAANHYLNYLKAHYDHGEYISTLVSLGRREEAAVYKFKLALPTSDVVVKLSKLKDSLRSNFQADDSLSHSASLVKEYIDLLEMQRPIEESDAKLEAEGRSTLFKDFPRRRSLIDLSVVTTVYYCCMYHYDLAENCLASPLAVKKRHKISDKQFTWTAISARAKLRQWKDIEALLTAKGFFGGTKLKSCIGFDKVVEILHKHNAPPEVLDKYLAMISDLDLRLQLAKKVQCSKAVVDTLVAMKNRQELSTYASTLDRYSKEGLYAADVLNSSAIKWK
ncbi:unnamed protein product [Lymnaea stagnalis]|uniref:Vps16 C-terminal domain-containing protein n=1 Tax=Lymnaea stagnalis TaxID=6523 RepID=A0AAV2HE54_LYMST